MTGHERAVRNADVVRARARGLGWEEIAGRFGLSERQCRRILDDYRASESRLHEIDPIETVEGALDQYDAAIEELALLAERTAHDAVRLGAIKTRLDVLRGKLDLMAAVGVLPRDLGQLHVEIDVRNVVRAIVNVFDEHGVPREAQEAVARVLRRPENCRSRSLVPSAANRNGALA